jgi:hypothetical protein
MPQRHNCSISTSWPCMLLRVTQQADHADSLQSPSLWQCHTCPAKTMLLDPTHTPSHQWQCPAGQQAMHAPTHVHPAAQGLHECVSRMCIKHQQGIATSLATALPCCMHSRTKTLTSVPSTNQCLHLTCMPCRAHRPTQTWSRTM